MATKAFLRQETIHVEFLQSSHNQYFIILPSETDGNRTIPPIASFELTKCVYLQQNHARNLLLFSYTIKKQYKLLEDEKDYF